MIHLVEASSILFNGTSELIQFPNSIIQLLYEQLKQKIRHILQKY